MIAIGLILGLASLQDLGEAFGSTRLQVRGGESIHALRDVDGDGARELLVLDPKGVEFRTLTPSGRFADGGARLPWPEKTLAWDLADLDGDGGTDLCVFTGSEVVLFRATEEGGFAEGVTVLGARGYLPRGITAVRFVRDVNGDGRNDLVLPGSGEFLVFLAGDGGTLVFGDPLRIAFDARIQLMLGGTERPGGRFGQSVSLPLFRVEDVDGDGLRDLVARTDDRIDFHLASPELPRSPTWTLDLEGLRSEVPTPSGIDLDDLLSMVQLVDWQVEDIDGVAPRDLVLQVGSTIRVYLGGSRTGPRRVADQALRASGHVLIARVRQVQGDERPDLQLLSTERLSIGRVLRWLILPGRLDFELFTFQNEGGVFPRKPTRSNTLALAIPRLLGMIDEVEEIGERLGKQFELPTRTAALDLDGLANDVVDVVDGELRVWRDAVDANRDAGTRLVDEAPGALVEAFLLRDLDALDDGETKVLELGDVENWFASSGALLRAELGDREPDHRIPLGPGLREIALLTADLDGDGRGDLIVEGEVEDDEVLLLLVQRDAGGAR